MDTSGHPDLQFLRSDAADPPVTVVREILVRPGNEPRFEGLMSELIREAARQPGHLGATVVRPQTPRSPYRFVYKFDRRSNLTAWHGSEMRRKLAEPMLSLIELDHHDEFSGLETWFDLPPHLDPPKWKTTLMSWGAIYVLVVVFSYAIKALPVSMPLPVNALVLTAIVVPLVAYIVGPWLGRVLRGWLHAGATLKDSRP